MENSFCRHKEISATCGSCEEYKRLLEDLKRAQERISNQSKNLTRLQNKIARHEPDAQEKRADALEKKLWEAREERDFWKKRAREEVERSLTLEEKIIEQRNIARKFSSLWKKLAKRYKSA